MENIYNHEVYSLVKKALHGVKWGNYPRNLLEDGLVELVARYNPNLREEKVRHDVGWAIANELNDGVELEIV